MRKRITLFLLLFVTGILLVSKELIIPKNVHIEEGLTEESKICDLSDLDIYQPIDLQVMDDFLIIGNGKPSEIVKLDLKGNVLIRKAKEGRGPGEFIFCLAPRKFGERILFIDLNNKIIFYDLNLNFIKEIKLALLTRDMIISKNNHLIFPERYGSEFYLSKYSMDGKPIDKFGTKKVKFNPKDELASYNKPRLLAYDRSRDTVWCDNHGKYELRSFKSNTEQHVIRPEIELFNKYKVFDKDIGEKVTELDGRGTRLIYANDFLYFFFHKKEIVYVDVFNLKNFSHAYRLRFSNKYILISHVTDNKFYGISYDEEEELILSEIKIKAKK